MQKISPKTEKHLQRWLLGLYGATFLVVLLAAYTGHLPLAWLEKIPAYDSIGHVVLYAIASYLGQQAVGDRRLWGRRLPLFPLGFALATAAEEALQSLSPQRTASWSDLICSLLGITLGWYLAGRSKR